MIKILDHSKSLTTLVNDTTNGLGQFQEVEAYVTEELNGVFEAEIDVLQTDPHFKDLEVGGLLSVDANEMGKQIFRIYKIDKPFNQVCTLHCEHLSYDLNKVPVSPFTATGSVNVCNGMQSHMMVTSPFTMTTDITNTTSNFSLDIPRSFRECLGGYEGSILDVFRPEYEWDNLTVKMLAHRGSDNGVRIAYGKNLTDFKQEENIENVYTSVLGYAVVDDVTYLGTIYDKIITSYPKVKIVDFSSDYESGEVPTQAELTTKAQTYATNNDIEIPNVNLTISFVPLYQTEEYKNIAPLERVQLGDTVHVYFEKLGVEASARVIKTVWNVNLQRYDSIELGNAKANLNTVINDSVGNAVNNALSDLDLDTGAIESEMLSMSKLIANSMGLHITKDSIGRIFLHNDETLANSQYQYQITAGGFMLSEDYGQTWNSGWDISGNVVVNSLATITLKFLEGYGMFMRFGDVNSNYIDVSPYANGVSFDGSGYVRFQPQGQFYVNNVNSSNQTLNTLTLGYANSVAQISLKNYDYSNRQLANAIEMDSNLTDENQVKYNQLYLSNYLTSTGTSYLQNDITLSSKTSFNAIKLDNYQLNGSTYLANRIYLYENTSQDILYLRNYKRNQNNLVANTVSLQSGTQNTLDIRNYNMNKDNYANQIRLLTASSGNGNSLYINNNNTDGNSVNSIQMTESGTLYLTCSADLRIQSSGAVRIMANYNSSSSDQDVLIQGKTIKLIREGSGKFSLYTGGSESGARYNIEVPSLSVGQTGYLSVYRAN